MNTAELIDAVGITIGGPRDRMAFRITASTITEVHILCDDEGVRGVYRLNHRAGNDTWIFYWTGWSDQPPVMAQVIGFQTLLPAGGFRGMPDGELDGRAAMQRMARERGMVVDWSSLRVEDKQELIDGAQCWVRNVLTWAYLDRWDRP